MTRFARAKGSKASNEKLPEEATPWDVLKNQAQGSKDKSKESTVGEKVNWKKVITNEQLVNQNVNCVWADFDDENKKKRKNSIASEVSDSKHTKKKKNNNQEEASDESHTQVPNDSKRHIKTKKMNQNDHEVVSKEGPTEELKVDERHADKSNFNRRDSQRSRGAHSQSSNRGGRARNNDSNGRGNVFNYRGGQKPWNQRGGPNQFNSNRGQKQFPKKFKDPNNKDFKRRKEDQGDMNVNINGQDVTLTRFDGFYVKKEDAERLAKLREDLKTKGVTRSEIELTIKGERRRAEKALARLKKNVCFNCRLAGHVLSQCPSLGQSEGMAGQVADGICYKCGSTEHTSFQCKASTGNNFKFATCFICKEQGHISKQCPDNPRGMYPKGGACKLCGDVTHLKKDCPQLMQEKAESRLTVGTLNENALEALDDNDTPVKEVRTFNTKKQNKIVKFT